MLLYSMFSFLQAKILQHIKSQIFVTVHIWRKMNIWCNNYSTSCKQQKKFHGLWLNHLNTKSNFIKITWDLFFAGREGGRGRGEGGWGDACTKEVLLSTDFVSLTLSAKLKQKFYATEQVKEIACIWSRHRKRIFSCNVWSRGLVMKKQPSQLTRQICFILLLHMLFTGIKNHRKWLAVHSMHIMGWKT